MLESEKRLTERTGRREEHIKHTCNETKTKPYQTVPVRCHFCMYMCYNFPLNPLLMYILRQLYIFLCRNISQYSHNTRCEHVRLCVV